MPDNRAFSESTRNKTVGWRIGSISGWLVRGFGYRALRPIWRIRRWTRLRFTGCPWVSSSSRRRPAGGRGSRARCRACASRIPNSLGRIRPTCVASAQCGPRRVVARHGATAPGRTVAACVQRALLDSHPVSAKRRRTEAKCTRLSVLARQAAVAVERLAASAVIPKQLGTS